MNRRRVLADAGLALSTLLGGCLDGSAYTGRTGGGDDGTHIENRTVNADGESTDDEKYTYDESRRDSIFVKNTTNDEVVVEILVERKSDGEILVENAYNIPRKTGLEIPDVAAVGDEYAITAKYDGVAEEHDWTVLSCAHEEGPAIGGETALDVDIFRGKPYFVHSDCDESGTRANRDLTYKDHGEYVINEECIPCTP